ncbi:hypothetical protein C7974DRAFT_361696 [Boeremia exigua]|uniref:uncharacterized protein n=1 Tax=Boeremia exigua TaxID=749465 RepID=UPI001E8E6D08|nr:uncharacterized protein C7974DRAFT_361696 [Boeremia exigua]KAH6621769.1 hypothetical protein C7974DRAFT_361696 [Boeremia exigua]
MKIDSFSRSRASSYMSWAGARTQSTLKRSASTVKTSWLDSHHQARSDFRIRSGRGCLWVLAFLWLCGLTTGFIVLCVWSTLVSDSWSSSGSLSACLPDDTFSLQPEDYQYWSNSGFFQITLGTGDLTFTQAKAIDVIWDIVVGRGGQALIAFFSWQTFVRYVTTSMEVQPVTFNTYRMIFLQNESLVLGIPRIIRDFSKRRGLHSRCAMVFIILTMMFVLIFPTLGSAMTGYSGNVLAYVPDSAGNFVPFNNFSIVLYTVHDGTRINQTDDFHATIYKSPNSNDPLLTDVTRYTYRFGKDGDCRGYINTGLAECSSNAMLWNISQYVGNYGTEPKQDQSSTFGNSSLGPPTLNITAYDVPNAFWVNRDTRPTGTGLATTFLSDGQFYDQQVITRDAQCQAQKTYRWGFSFIQLNIMVILLWVWTLGVMIMYISSKMTRLQRGREDVAGEYKAVFELSDAMHSQLTHIEKEEANDVRNMTESALRRRITKDLYGGSIAYDTALLPESTDGKEGNEWTLKAWAKREVWWLLALTVAVVIDIFVIRSFIMHPVRNDLWLFPALPLAIGFAMYVGLTCKSRLMVLFWAALCVCILPAIVLSVTIQMLSGHY